MVTDETFFQGQLSYLKDIKSVIDLPLLRKDFIIDPYQIYESKVYKADSILLIMSILEDNEIKEYHENWLRENLKEKPKVIEKGTFGQDDWSISIGNVDDEDTKN